MGEMNRTVDQRDEILRALDFFHPEKTVFELIAFGVKESKCSLWDGWVAQGGKVAGWFMDHEKAADMALTLDREVSPEGIYITANPCKEALLARADHRLISVKFRTADSDIHHYSSFLIDIDPKRPSGISSTDKEHGLAIQTANRIKDDLAKQGWPEPLVGDSGNGAYLVYPTYSPRMWG